ncbi:hypothetical protein, partial [Streptomyces flaveolus]|uniref:hypothetical protein n=1 Tax=Streptomyces flaveolus TaxID=67297 RepID=UPI0033254AF5
MTTASAPARVEDELTKVRGLLKAYGNIYETAGRPAIREDVRRRREEAERQYGECGAGCRGTANQQAIRTSREAVQRTARPVVSHKPSRM